MRQLTNEDEIDVSEADAFDRVGYDDFFEDIFGVSLRGLRSIRTILLKPADFFDAARQPDWGGRFTPSLRLWLGLMALIVALQFFWANDSSYYMRTMASLPTQVIEVVASQPGSNIAALEGYDVMDAARRINQRNILIYPFIFVALFLLLAAIFRPWTQGENFVVSQRYMFGVIVAGSVFGVVTTLLSPFVPESAFGLFGVFQTSVVFLIYALTALRGPMRLIPRGRVGMSLVMAMLMMATVFTAQIVSLLISSLPVFAEIASLAKS